MVRQRAGARLGLRSGSLLAHAAGRPYQADQPPVDGDQPTDGASCLLIVAVQSTARRCSSPLQLLASAAGSRWAFPRCLSSGWWPSAVRRRGGLYLALPAALETAERRAQETCPENLRRAPRHPRGLYVTHAPTWLPHVVAAAAASCSSPAVPRCPGRWRGGGLGGRALPTPQHGRWRRVCTSDGGGGITRERRALSRGALVLDSQRRHLVLDSQRRHRCCWVHVHGLP